MKVTALGEVGVVGGIAPCGRDCGRTVCRRQAASEAEAEAGDLRPTTSSCMVR